MPQVTCLAQGGCSVNVCEWSTLGGMVLRDMIVCSFNMILMHWDSVGCMLCGYAISSQQDPVSMCFGFLVFDYWYDALRQHGNVEGRA